MHAEGKETTPVTKAVVEHSRRRKKQTRSQEAKARLAAVRSDAQGALLSFDQATRISADCMPLHVNDCEKGGLVECTGSADEFLAVSQWVPPDTSKTEIDRLRELLANGVALSFDLVKWCNTDCCTLSLRDRLQLILEQCRPEAMKLFVRLGHSQQWQDEPLSVEVDANNLVSMFSCKAR
eukprot:SAG31_NODE_2688_length_5250_cov_11.245583_7_plen_180_part_00